MCTAWRASTSPEDVTLQQQQKKWSEGDTHKKARSTLGNAD